MGGCFSLKDFSVSFGQDSGISAYSQLLCNKLGSSWEQLQCWAGAEREPVQGMEEAFLLSSLKFPGAQVSHSSRF